MSWCEHNAVDYVFGLARNVRLVRAIGAELQEAAAESAPGAALQRTRVPHEKKLVPPASRRRQGGAGRR
jgi:hypothetical protein